MEKYSDLIGKCLNSIARDVWHSDWIYRDEDLAYMYNEYIEEKDEVIKQQLMDSTFDYIIDNKLPHYREFISLRKK